MERVVVSSTGFAARVLGDSTLAGVDVTNCLCRDLSSVRVVDMGAAPRPSTIVAAANGDDAFALAIGDRTVAVVAVTDGAVKWATSMPEGFVVRSVALFSAESAAAVLDDGRVALMVPKEGPVRCPDAAGVTAIAAVSETQFLAATAKGVELRSIADDGVSTEVQGTVKVSFPAKDAIAAVAGALAADGGLGAVAVTTASGRCDVFSADGSSVHTTASGVNAVAAVGPTAFVICCGRKVTAVVVRAAAAASPSGKKKGGRASGAATAAADVATVELSAQRFPAAAITGATMTVEGDRVQLAGCVGSSGIAAAALTVTSDAASAATLVGDLEDDGAAMYGHVASLIRGAQAHADGTLSGRPMATCHYACLCATVDTDADTSAPLVTAVTTTLSLHARRARDRGEIAALAALLRGDVATAHTVAGAPVQWNHNLLRGAMKLLGAHGARSAVLSAAETAAAPTTDFVTAVSSCANAVGAGVTLQQQLGFRLQLPPQPVDSNPTSATAKRGTPEYAMQLYGRMLVAGRSLAAPCTAMAARWGALIADAERRGVKEGSSAETADDADTVATAGPSNRAAAKRGNDSTAMRQVHGGAVAETRQGGGSDTVAAKVRAHMARLPSELHTTGAVFPAHARSDAGPVHHAVKSRLADRGMSSYERATLGLAPLQ